MESKKNSPLKIGGAWSWFSRNPVLATRVMICIMGAKLLRPFNPTYKRYEHELEEIKKRYPEEAVQSLAVGAGVLLTLIFAAFCSIAYLMQVLY
jgi:hypothetical protein